jgi:hypothetical protein
VLLAARAVRRAGADRADYEALEEACLRGSLGDYELRPDAAPALAAAVDAARAAEASLDFSAAEAACLNSTLRALGYAAGAADTTLQAAILVTSDLDLLRFATEEGGVERYDPLSRDVLGRLTPVG